MLRSRSCDSFARKPGRGVFVALWRAIHGPVYERKASKCDQQRCGEIRRHEARSLIQLTGVGWGESLIIYYSAQRQWADFTFTFASAAAGAAGPERATFGRRRGAPAGLVFLAAGDPPKEGCMARLAGPPELESRRRAGVQERL